MPSSPAFTRDDLQRVAPRVLERLRSMATLPEHGTVAGQAVASVVWEELGHPARGPINDIDVFVNVNMPRPMRGLPELDNTAHLQPRTRTQPTTHNRDDVKTDQDHYSHVKFIALRATTSILRTYQIDLVNYTLIQSPLFEPGALGHNDAVSQSLIDGFDLNIVGVGINLESGQVVCSDGFLEFLNTSMIRVETANTPAHTMVRLAKKVFGGEIEGATCDYAQERQLLEVALQCQEVAETAKTSFINTITRFGGGKYKSLHDRFSEHLPPLQLQPKRQHDGVVYNFYQLQVLPDLSPGEAELIERAAKMPYHPAQLAYVTHFPRIYELFHPERSLLPSEEIAKRRALFDAISSQDGEVDQMFLIHRALGKGVVKMPLTHMDDEDAYAFFFNQHAALDPKSTQEAADAWNGLSFFEQQTLYRLEQRADAVACFAADKDAFWKVLLDSKGAALFDALASVKNENAHFAQEIIGKCLGWLPQLGEKGVEIARCLMNAHGTLYSYQMSPLEVMCKAMPTQANAALAQTVAQLAFDQWPQLHDASPQARRGVLTSWARLGLPVSPSLYEDFPVSSLNDTLFAVREISHSNSAFKLQACLQSLIEQTLFEQLSTPENPLCCNLLGRGYYDTFDALIKHHIQHPEMPQMLEQLRNTLLHDADYIPFDPPSPGLTPRRLTPSQKQSVSHIEQWILQAQSHRPANPGRRVRI